MAETTIPTDTDYQLSIAIHSIKCFETPDTNKKTQIELRGHGSGLPLITCAFRVRFAVNSIRGTGGVPGMYG